MSATDIPSLAVAVSRNEAKWTVIIGARPQRAMVVNYSEEILSGTPNKEEIDSLLNHVIENVKFGSNMRGSREYRQILAKVFINRAIEEIVGGTYAN